MSFGEKLNRLRVAKGLSLQDVANAAGISKAHVWNLEKGQSDNPSIELVMKLADLFRVRVADLVGENPDAADEAPEIVAMFRDLKSLNDRDREVVRGLMEQFKRNKSSDA